VSRFDVLIGSHIPHLRRYARALTGDVTRADDLVQDTLVRAWLKFHLWQPALDLRPWLFTIMHNLYVNQVRANIRRERIPALDGETDLPSARPNQTDMLEVSEVLACLDRLPPEQREVLLLVSLESLNYTQVGKILGIPVGTVTSRLARARMRLRTLLEGGAREGDGKGIE
jgi:RNA polymerase sigma-70 factor (ECF subfamily)